jgi:hypothetical protein
MPGDLGLSLNFMPPNRSTMKVAAELDCSDTIPASVRSQPEQMYH